MYLIIILIVESTVVGKLLNNMFGSNERLFTRSPSYFLSQENLHEGYSACLVHTVHLLMSLPPYSSNLWVHVRVFTSFASALPY